MTCTEELPVCVLRRESYGKTQEDLTRPSLGSAHFSSSCTKDATTPTTRVRPPSKEDRAQRSPHWGSDQGTEIQSRRAAQRERQWNNKEQRMFSRQGENQKQILWEISYCYNRQYNDLAVSKTMTLNVVVVVLKVVDVIIWGNPLELSFIHKKFVSWFNL